MIDIGIRTPAELIDLLITNNIHCYMAQDNIMDKNLSDEERFKASQKAHEYNNRRNQLIRRLDEMMGYGEFTQLEKSYNSQFEKQVKTKMGEVEK